MCNLREDNINLNIRRIRDMWEFRRRIFFFLSFVVEVERGIKYSAFYVSDSSGFEHVSTSFKDASPLECVAVCKYVAAFFMGMFGCLLFNESLGNHALIRGYLHQVHGRLKTGKIPRHLLGGYVGLSTYQTPLHVVHRKLI